MKILTLHCDFIRFKPLKKAIKNPEELSEERKKEIVVKDPLVILTAVEKGDNDKVVKEMIASVKKTAGEVKAERIVLYPYAHLSSNLSDPTTALEYLAEAENVLKKEGFEVTRAPFGYYKEFELKCKGHPLSELSKQFRAEEDSTSMKASVKEDIIDPSKLYNKISQTKLDTSKLKENDHRIIGQKLGLFMFNESSPGAPYWLPNGLIVYHELLKFWREEHSKAGYKENMFVSDMGEDGVYCLKQMNCPNAMIIFKSQTRSYKDLPLRLSDADRLH